MQTTISGKQVDVGDALRTHIEQALNTIIGKYWEHALEAHVTLSRRRAFFHCDVLIHAGRGITMKAEAEADQPYRAFDAAAEHVGKRLRRYRRRLSEHHRALANRERPEKAQAYILQALPIEAEPEPEQASDGEGGDAPVIVAEMPAEIASLTVGEAVMRMDLASQPVLVFRNSGHGGINIVYRRPDGHIGWIDPRGADRTAPAG
ncbi:MAG: ribosome-associated translation inhibitor RaiA [Alphaproteobacteria bacterium]|nr:ribosome-associated translation inhibitor RaiA [Alphaproteobacteria bacterium]